MLKLFFIVLVFFILPTYSYASCSRIVSLAPSVTETLFYLGLGKNVVGVTRYAKWPKNVKYISKIGGYYDPNFASIVYLKPTIVMYTYTQRMITSDLEKLGLNHIMLRYTNLNYIIRSMKRIEKICGVNDKDYIYEFAKKIKYIINYCKSHKPKRVLVAFGDPGITPIIAAGKNSIYGSILKALNAINVYNVDISWGNLTISELIKLNPDDIFVLNKTNNTNSVFKNWMSLPIAAKHNKSIWILKSDVYFVPGPRIIYVLKHMSKLLYYHN